VRRGDGILEEEQPVLLDVLGKLHCIDGMQALVHVVQQLDPVIQPIADVLDHPEHGAAIGTRVEVVPVRCVVGCVEPGPLTAIAPHLHTDMPKALLDEPDGVVFHLPGIAAVGMDVHGSRLAAFAAEKLIDGHARSFAFDIPQGLIDAGNRVVEHRTVAPIAMDHRHLPDLFDAIDIPADQERLEVAFDGRLHRKHALRERGTAKPVETGLRGGHLDDDQPRLAGLRQNRLDVGDGDWRSHAYRSATRRL